MLLQTYLNEVNWSLFELLRLGRGYNFTLTATFDVFYWNKIY